MSRLKKLRDQDRAFDREFWQKCGADAIFNAMWDMVLDYRKLKGLVGDEPRLQRSIGRLKRRGS